MGDCPRATKRMAIRQRVRFISVNVLTLLLLLQAGFAHSSDDLRTYIVRMSELDKPSTYTTHRLWYYSTFSAARGDATAVTAVDGEDHPEGILHTYGTVFHGFSARLTAGEAEEMAAQPGVLTVHPDGVRQLHTTHTPEFLGLDPSGGLLVDAGSGEDVIIGVLDTGVWPESKSFDDSGLGPIPSKWKGSCVQEASFNASSCNKKLIGAKYYLKGHEAETNRSVDPSVEFRSPRDGEGHGTHTASTAGGSAVPNASLFGFAAGTARGMAPKARLAVYKVCWRNGGCSDSDILAAFDDAVADGVDVISLSAGGSPGPYYEDAFAIGAFGATKKGVFVSCSAGNDGPESASVTNVAPWITTVAASTVDRTFPALVSLGNGESFEGVSLYSGKGLGSTPLPLLYAGNATAPGGNATLAAVCQNGTLDAATVAGKIVLCDRGVVSAVAKGIEVLAAGGLGMIVVHGQASIEGVMANAHVLPAADLTIEASSSIAEYIFGDLEPRALITFGETMLGVKPAPVMASFSSRGPNPVTPEILKPDITGPGVNILAAWTGVAGPSGLDDDRRVDFNIISGTSMSCPHISGVAALLKAAHPEWTPAAIKSAMMTTAYVYDNAGGSIGDADTGSVTDSFSYGAGHVDPQSALDPGLVYDLDVSDYVNFFCSLDYPPDAIRQLDPSITSCPEDSKRGSPNDLNYPSYTAVFNQSAVSSAQATTFNRTLTNVGSPEATYTANWTAPAGATIEVKPDVLIFSEGQQKLSFQVRIVAEYPGYLGAIFGWLSWSDGIHDGIHSVQSPLVVNWV